MQTNCPYWSRPDSNRARLSRAPWLVTLLCLLPMSRRAILTRVLRIPSFNLFEELVRHGKTIVMVTHDPSLTSRTHSQHHYFRWRIDRRDDLKIPLPQLRHRHMLEFTKIAEERIYQPNETIISRDQSVDYFFMIRKAVKWKWFCRRKQEQEFVISRLQAGEFFGEIELMRGGKSIANVRAGDASCEVLAIPRADFLRVMNESPITAEAIGQDRTEAVGSATRSQWIWRCQVMLDELQAWFRTILSTQPDPRKLPQILYIEDSDEARSLVRRLLSQQVCGAGSGRPAGWFATCGRDSSQPYSARPQPAAHDRQ